LCPKTEWSHPSIKHFKNLHVTSTKTGENEQFYWHIDPIVIEYEYKMLLCSSLAQRKILLFEHQRPILVYISTMGTFTLGGHFDFTRLGWKYFFKKYLLCIFYTFILKFQFLILFRVWLAIKRNLLDFLYVAEASWSQPAPLILWSNFE
jgi:hypothetical protein